MQDSEMATGKLFQGRPAGLGPDDVRIHRAMIRLSLPAGYGPINTTTWGVSMAMVHCLCWEPLMPYKEGGLLGRAFEACFIIDDSLLMRSIYFMIGRNPSAFPERGPLKREILSLNDILFSIVSPGSTKPPRACRKSDLAPFRIRYLSRFLSR